MTPPKARPAPATGPFTPPGYTAPTNALPATVPCPSCGAPAPVSALEDGRATAAVLLYLSARCACGLRLDAVGVGPTVAAAEGVALADLRAVYRRRKAAMEAAR